MKEKLLKHKDALTSILGVIGGFSIVATFILHFFEISNVESLKTALILIFAICFSLNGWFSGKKIDSYKKYIKK